MMISQESLPDVMSEVLQRVTRIEQFMKTSFALQIQEEGSLLDISQAGKLLHLTTNTMYKMVQKRALPYNKRGKKLYFLKDDLMNWIKAGKIKTEVELKAEAEEVFISKNKKK